VEIYSLTRAVSTTHLETFLLDYLWGKTAANIKWVDDEHALAVFPCAEAAQVLLESAQRDYKVRPYTKASRAALHIAPEGEGWSARALRHILPWHGEVAKDLHLDPQLQASVQGCIEIDGMVACAVPCKYPSVLVHALM
jgi:hypothetical protein